MIIENSLELRMYSLTLYQFSGIMSGIQCGHAAIKYGVKFKYNKLYRDWAENWETFIFLNAGTSITLNERIKELEEAEIDFAVFKEPDLYTQTTAVAFILDERVFNKEKYPDFVNPTFPFFIDSEHKAEYFKWGESLGGFRNVWLREWFNLNRFKLAGT